jgi:hypothetical protein
MGDDEDELDAVTNGLRVKRADCKSDAGEIVGGGKNYRERWSRIASMHQ